MVLSVIIKVLLVAVEINSRDRYEIIGLRKISHYKTTLFKFLPEKSVRDVSKLLKQTMQYVS